MSELKQLQEEDFYAEAADANTAYREITSEAELIERYRVLVTLSN